MKILHRDLAGGRWQELNFFDQMANIGSEIERAINWKSKNEEYFRLAFDRALELLDLTIEDPKNKIRGRLNELLRIREALADYFAFDNIYGSSNEKWKKYFYAFNYAANMKNPAGR